jgi:hypothetical protein
MDSNIEFAHIYVNESFSSEHYRAIALLQEEIRSLELKKKTYSTILLIDDYNPTEWLLDLDKLLNELKEQKSLPDFVVLESSLIKYVPELLEIIKNSHSDIPEKKISKNGKYRCSFLLVAWYLLRLGLIKLSSDRNIFYMQNIPTDDFAAKKIINILPQRFMAVERTVNRFMKKINLETIENKNEYRFY